MTSSLKKILYGIQLIVLFLTTACNEKPYKEMTKIDIENIDFNSSVASWLQLGEYIRLEASPITSSVMYYSYDVDTLCFGQTLFSGNYENEFSQTKPKSLDDVFDFHEAVNRVDVYSSENSTIDAICLEINNKNDADTLLKYLGSKIQGEYSEWTDTEKNATYMLHKDEWMIDETKMETINFCILKSDGRVGTRSLVSLFREYYE